MHNTITIFQKYVYTGGGHPSSRYGDLNQKPSSSIWISYVSGGTINNAKPADCYGDDKDDDDDNDDDEDDDEDDDDKDQRAAVARSGNGGRG